ncbi:unnamed protein product, partial [marine sediment metagenome]
NTKFLAGTNPGGIGHAWVKKIWMDKEFSDGEMEADTFYYVPAKAKDNPHLDDSYYLALEGLPEEMKKAFIEGDWNLFKGQYFSEWRDSKHVVEPFKIPEEWKRYRGYDHGRDKPASCHWYAIDYDGNVWVYKEFYQTGLNANEIAKQIVKMSENEKIEYTIADSSIFSKIGAAETI